MNLNLNHDDMSSVNLTVTGAIGFQFTGIISSYTDIPVYVVDLSVGICLICNVIIKRNNLLFLNFQQGLLHKTCQD